MRSFNFFAHEIGCSVPTLLFEIVCDEIDLADLAGKALAKSPSRLAIEVREAERLIYSLDRNGAVWVGRGAPTGAPKG